MIGANLTHQYGFRTCCDILALVTVGHFVLYFLVIDAIKMFRLRPKIEDTK